MTKIRVEGTGRFGYQVKVMVRGRSGSLHLWSTPRFFSQAEGGMDRAVEVAREMKRVPGVVVRIVQDGQEDPRCFADIDLTPRCAWPGCDGEATHAGSGPRSRARVYCSDHNMGGA
jgi:hypothetical protein